jgi:hypothetical protein
MLRRTGSSAKETRSTLKLEGKAESDATRTHLDAKIQPIDIIT